MKCLMCGFEGQSIFTEIETIDYKSQSMAVPMAFTRCDGCGHEYVPTEQIKANDRAVLAAKRLVDGLLTPEQVRHAREVLCLSQSEAASLLGGGRNAFSKYERGEVAQSEAMDRLIRLCSRHPELLDDLRELSGISPAQAKVVSMEQWRTEKKTPVLHVINRTGVRASIKVERQEFANEA